MNLSLNVLLMKDDDVWSAQCLEHNIAAQGETTNKALFELTRTIVGELALRAKRGQEHLSDIPRAPDFYWKAFGEAQSLNMTTRSLFRPDDDIPPAFILPEFRECRVV